MSHASPSSAVLHFMCGKMAAGKTTLARRLAEEHGALLICEDLWLQRLYPVEIAGFADYLQYSQRLQQVIGPHVTHLLRHGLSVVMDFPANIPASRQWMRSLFEAAGAGHVLHFVDTPVQRCLQQLEKRNHERPEGSMPMSEADFHAISALFQPPTAEEGFILQRHE